jgi:3-dehydroquinate dehydratase/shikimate dehydrogenase
MTSAGAEVTIFNRTASRSAQLANEFGCHWKPWDQRNASGADILINGTSLGMHPNVNDCPVDPESLRPGLIVFDTVYNPLETMLLRRTREAGGQAVNGADMLVFQAVEQIRLWLKAQQTEEICIPADIMKIAVLSKLKNRDN